MQVGRISYKGLNPGRDLALAIITVASTLTAVWVGVSYSWTPVGVAVGALALGLVCARSTQFLIFVTAMVLMLNQTVIFGGSDVLSLGRWMVLLLFCAIFALQFFSREHIREPRLLDAIALFFLLYTLASTTYSIAPDVTLQRGLSICLMYVAIFWGIWGYADRASAEKIVQALIYAVGLILLMGLVAAPFWPGAWQRTGRFQGLFTNPNAIGLLAAIILPLVVWKVFQSRWWPNIMLLGVVALSLVLSASRNGFFVSLIAIVYLFSKARGSKVLLAGGTLLALLFLVVAVEAVDVGSVVEDYAVGRLVNPLEVGDASGRFQLWPVAISLIETQVMTGHGFGTEEFALVDIGRTLRDFSGGYFHNSYLGMAFQLGIVGLVLLIAPLIVLVATQFWRSRHDYTISLSHALQAVLLAGLLTAFFESWIYSVGNAYSFPFWVCVMLLARDANREKSQQAPVTSRQKAVGSRQK
ncbi:MAG TPA: O-antigen ligase family protein [Chloroflexia bacterium]|nr:O-antigen ligase family protein [Chloroflexia bacterium]